MHYFVRCSYLKKICILRINLYLQWINIKVMSTMQIYKESTWGISIYLNLKYNCKVLLF
jgi:hypothetical protein